MSSSRGKDRDILYALSNDGLEFRCSYSLSGRNLASVANNLVKHRIQKMDGDLDYKLIRTPETPISEKEIGYILNDVLIIEYYIREAIEESGDITKIPLTNTGYVRNYVRNKTIKGNSKDSKHYRNLMKNLTLETNEYHSLKYAFTGGFTHANINYVEKVVEDVSAKDLASSYPAVMLSKQYPMSKGEEYQVKDEDDFYEQMDLYCCLFYVRFKNIVRKANESYISHSKTLSSKHVSLNNGRIEAASEIEMWITEVDWLNIVESYDFEEYTIGTMIRYRRGYLPTTFANAILDMYDDKTRLKNVKGKETEYMRSKGMLNSAFGMAVQDPVQDSFEWNDDEKEIERESTSESESLKKYNKSRNRFLYYPWGVWITAYARRNLFKMIIRLGDDYVYADTDSITYKNPEKNDHLFEVENKRIITELEESMRYHNIDLNRLKPKDPDGIERHIGIWEDDADYTRFKTLGAKRYMVEENGKINITVSGINKSYAVPYMIEEFGEDIFERFGDSLYIPAGYSGKSTHTYIDDTRQGTVKDYLGDEYEYLELSGIHLEETHYELSISDEFQEMIEWMQMKKAGY